MSRSVASAAALLLATSVPALAQDFNTSAGSIQVETVAKGLAKPWGLAFLPDGSMLVTEKAGRLRHVAADGTVSEPISGVPEVDAGGQGGLLDVTVHPDFAENRLVAISYSEPGPGGNSTAAAFATLSDDMSRLEDLKVVFSQKPKVESRGHFGSRVVFDGEGHVYITTGERMTDKFRVQAQDLGSHLGKIIRLNEDGSVPDDNPFAGQADAQPEIWSYGHRNVQAAAMNPASGALWAIEHGPKGGDELNIPEPGKNYGWPVVSYGVNYDGTPVNKGAHEAAGMVGPIYQWTPVIAPSGMMFHSGAMFPEWKGDLFVGGLKSTALVRLDVEGGAIKGEERMIEALGQRIRDVAEGPDGAIYVITDANNGAVLRISRAD